MSVYAYTRVSTARQSNDGESLDVQRTRIEGYAQSIGEKVDSVYEERGISGSIPFDERPKGKLLLAKIVKGDSIIAFKLDRMFRSAHDALRICSILKEERGVHLHFIDLGGDVTGNGISRLVFTILSAVAEAERDRTRERIRDVKEHQREQGKFLGGTPPFGYFVNKHRLLEKEPLQQKAILLMRQLRKKGMAYRAISAAIGSRLQLKISHAGVLRILEGVRKVS